MAHTDPHKPSVSLIKAICYPDSVRFTTAATKHGCEHERIAINAYKLIAVENHKNLIIKPAGLVLYSKKAFFGTSPDSFLECECCGMGVVKCPYSCKFAGLKDVAEKSSKFCLQKDDDGNFHLDKNHPYFYQCQMQILVTERLYCDFVVWGSSGDIHIERIFLDKNFIELQLEKAEKVFWLAIIPELLAKWYTRHDTTLPQSSAAAAVDISSSEDEDDDGTWCYCKSAKGGAMIGCENVNCDVKWFYMKCLKIKNKPKGKWFCPTCHSSCGRKRSKVRR